MVKVRNEARRLFGRNPSGWDRFSALLPCSSRQWVDHCPLLARCTAEKRPPPQRAKQISTDPV